MRLVVEGKAQDIEVEIVYKAVKNVNLRVLADGSVRVSAPSYVSIEDIGRFVQKHETFIMQARLRWQSRVSQEELLKNRAKAKGIEERSRSLFEGLNERVYALFRMHHYDVPKATITWRYMRSRWGSCVPAKGAIRMNTKLVLGPIEFAQYVMIHEYAHFIEPNHSRRFHAIVTKIEPNWKDLKKRMEAFFQNYQ